MRRLQMGMWNGLDKDYWHTYNLGVLNGIEACQYKDTEDLAALLRFCREKNIAFGLHTPVLRTEEEYPSTVSMDMEDLQKTVSRIEQEVSLAAEYGADYLLFHYPYPPIYPSIHDPKYWNGKPTQHESYDSTQINPDLMKEYSQRLFEALIGLQEKYKQKIVLEYDFFGDFEEIYVNMFLAYPQLELVIDTQRIDMHKRCFPDFNPYAWLDKVADHVYLAHYSNISYEPTFDRHLPVIPKLCAEPNYGDAYQYLQYLSERNNRFHVTFEHNPTKVSIEELRECYEAVRELISEEKR